MSYLFFDHDGRGDEIPCADYDFELLLNICFQYSEYVSFIVEESDFARYPELISYTVNEERDQLLEAYNMHVRYSRESAVSFFYCSEEFKKLILSISKDLWSFIHAWGFANPEDPTFYRRDGSVFFSAIVHEGEAVLYPRKSEDISAFLDRIQWYENSEL